MAASVHRIEVHYTRDPRLKTRTDRIRTLGFLIEELHLADVYTIATDARDFTREELLQIGSQLMNPVVQECSVDEPTRMSFDHAIEVGFLPGVTDNVGATARQTIEDFFSMKFRDGESVYTSQLYFVCGRLVEEELSRLASTLANPLVNRVHRKTRQEYGTRGMDVIVPEVRLHELLTAETVDLDSDDRELSRIGKEGIPDPITGQRRGPLALDLAQLHAIRDYFTKKGRKPTDVELEALAQTWSEHCKHTIFASAMDDDVPDGLYKTYIQAATNRIRKEKGEHDICVTVFTDNSGAIIFDDQYLVTHKVETHNSPSALDPFGGALTGIVGVNRDTIGFGLGAKPCINVYGFCVGDPDTDLALFRGKERQNPVLSPRRILDGVVHGVGVGGNCSGIPTPQGFVYFDTALRGKTSRFCRDGRYHAPRTRREETVRETGTGRRSHRCCGRTGGKGRHPRRHLLLRSARPGKPGDRGADRRPDHPEEVLRCDRQGSPGSRAVPQHHGQWCRWHILLGCRDGKRVQRLPGHA